MLKLAIGCFSYLLLTSSSQASFDIKIEWGDGFTDQTPFGGDPALANQAAYRKYFEIAEHVWESVITGYRGTAPSGFTGPTIRANLNTGGGAFGGTGFFEDFGGYTMSKTGRATMDTTFSPDADTTFDNEFAFVTIHEVGHALGFGITWTSNGVYDIADRGKYTGAYGLAAFLSEFNNPINPITSSVFDYVPVETNFKVTTPTDGSNDAHWDGDSDNTTSDPSLNVDFDGNINTDFAGRDSFGLEYNSDHPLFGSYFTTSEKLAVRPTGDVVTVGSTVRRLEGELLTATTGTGGPRFLSDTTIAQFDDIGYVTVLNAIPEPSSLMLFSLTSIGLLVRRRRR